MVTLYFVRHGETDANKVFASGQSLSVNRSVLVEVGGATNVALNDTGRDQAKKAALLLPKQFDALYASPLLRTRETGEIICRELGIDPTRTEFRDALIEYKKGTFEGKSFDAISQEIGINALEWSLACAYDYRSYQGDCWSDIYDRVNSFLNEMKKNHDGQVVMVSTSAGIIRMAYKVLYEKTSPTISRSVAIKNASVHEFLI